MVRRSCCAGMRILGILWVGQLPPSIPDIKAAEKSVQPDGRAWDSSVTERALKGLWSESRTRHTTQRKLLNHTGPMNRLSTAADTMGNIVASFFHRPLFNLNNIYCCSTSWLYMCFANKQKGIFLFITWIKMESYYISQSRSKHWWTQDQNLNLTPTPQLFSEWENLATELITYLNVQILLTWKHGTIANHLNITWNNTYNKLYKLNLILKHTILVNIISTSVRLN